MNRQSQMFLCFSMFAFLAGVARAETVRPGMMFSVRLETKINAKIAHSGDGIPVTVPDGLQIDPKGKPEIPAGTRGTAIFRTLESTPEGVKYDITSFIFESKGRKIELKTGFPPADQNAGKAPIQKASTFKKSFLPPLIGFLIWKDKAILPAGKDLTLMVMEEKSWNTD